MGYEEKITPSAQSVHARPVRVKRGGARTKRDQDEHLGKVENQCQARADDGGLERVLRGDGGVLRGDGEMLDLW